MAGQKKPEGPKMNYFQLPRKRLQSLCKRHGFPANKTNQLMAGFLASHCSDNLPVQTQESKDRAENDTESNVNSVKNGVTSKRWTAWVEQVELFPGIPDVNSLTDIAPKLSWRDVRSLASVSPGWRRAIGNRQVYKERVCTQSTESFAVINGIHPGLESITMSSKMASRNIARPDHTQDIRFLALYSMRDKYWCKLPPIPFCKGIPSACQHISLDGKVYVLGGVSDNALFGGVPNYASFSGSKEVYALDLAGQGLWKRCARMHTPRLDFGTGVLNGKVYVFGGCSLAKPALACEVYDPLVNAWSPLKAMPIGRINFKVATVGEEIILYGGEFFDDLGNAKDALVLDIYHPFKDEWRQIKPIGKVDWDQVFMAQGKFHRTGLLGICAYNFQDDLWTRPYYFLKNGPICNVKHRPYNCDLGGRTLAIGDEILHASLFGQRLGFMKCCLFQSNGFCSDNKQITWELVKCSVFFDSRSSFMCPIQL